MSDRHLPDEEFDVGGVGNYYGCLTAKREGDTCFWGIENWDGMNWEEIPRSLYDELLKYHQSWRQPSQTPPAKPDLAGEEE